jgi:hypothetical protein
MFVLNVQRKNVRSFRVCKNHKAKYYRRKWLQKEEKKVYLCLSSNAYQLPVVKKCQVYALSKPVKMLKEVCDNMLGIIL